MVSPAERSHIIMRPWSYGATECSSGKPGTARDVDGEHFVPLFSGDIFDIRGFKDAGIVDQQIDLAKMLQDFVDSFWALSPCEGRIEGEGLWGRSSISLRSLQAFLFRTK